MSRAKPLPSWTEGLVPDRARKSSKALSAALTALSEAQGRVAEAQVELELADNADREAANRTLAKNAALPAAKTPGAKAKLEGATRLLMAADRKVAEATNNVLSALGHSKDEILEAVEAERRTIGGQVSSLCDQVETLMSGARRLDALQDALELVDGSRHETFAIHDPVLPDEWVGTLAAVRAAVG